MGGSKYSSIASKSVEDTQKRLSKNLNDKSYSIASRTDFSETYNIMRVEEKNGSPFYAMQTGVGPEFKRVPEKIMKELQLSGETRAVNVKTDKSVKDFVKAVTYNHKEEKK